MVVRRRSRSAPCKALVQEFPDISISRRSAISRTRSSLTPRRTLVGTGSTRRAMSPGCARFCRMQRDEFLPLRGYPSELAAGRAGDMQGAAPRTRGRQARVAHERKRARARRRALLPRKTCSRRRSADAKLVRELEEYGVVKRRCAAVCATSTRPSARSSAPCQRSLIAVWDRQETCAYSALLRGPRGEPVAADSRAGASLT